MIKAITPEKKTLLIVRAATASRYRKTNQSAPMVAASRIDRTVAI
jgi:hypothetical protein